MTSIPLPVLRARLATRRLTGRLLSGLRTAPYARRWLILGVLIGLVAGVGAIVFYSLLREGTHFLLTDIGGFRPAGTAGEGGVQGASGFSRPWAIPLVVAGGGLLSGLLVFGLAPEAEGHGTDAAIAAVHSNPKGIRPRTALVKIIASALTIGSGGSGGREGPTAQISATFGSILARTLNLTPADARIAVTTGISSGIGAIFRAPLGGAVLGAELLYRDDLEVEAILPSLVASIVAFAVFGAVEGFSPIFGYHTGFGLTNVGVLWVFALVGLAAGLMGRLYAVSFYRITDAFSRLRLPRSLRPALAGLAVGGIGLAVPGVLGTGYGQVQQALDRKLLLGLPLWVVLAIPVAKILATGLSIGSGGSGGIFGPGMVIGGATGAALWRLLDLVGAAPHDPTPLVIVGMIACFGAVAHAPLAVMLMVGEMTGNLSLLAPAMVAVALATLVVGNTTIYRSQLRSRADSPAHRYAGALPAAGMVPISEVMTAPRLVVQAGQSASEALDALQGLALPGAPVVNRDGAFLGSLQTPRLAELVAAGHQGQSAGRLADVEAMTVPVEATLAAGIDAIATSRGAWVPVLDSDMHVVGILAATDLVRGYRLSLRHSLRRLGEASPGAVLSEFTLPAEAPAVGALVADLPLPRGTVIITVLRSGTMLFCEADTRLQAGDVLNVLSRPAAAAQLATVFGGEPAQSRPTGPVPARSA